jgi:hypothetical protein
MALALTPSTDKNAIHRLQMEVVAMIRIVIRPQNHPEPPTRTGVDHAQKLALLRRPG